MLYEPFMLNMVWKSTERFGNLSLEKYGILKWKMYRNPEFTSSDDWHSVYQITCHCSCIWSMRGYCRQNNEGRSYHKSCLKCLVNFKTATLLHRISQSATPPVSPITFLALIFVSVQLFSILSAILALLEERVLRRMLPSQPNAHIYLPHLKEHEDSLKPIVHLGQRRTGGLSPIIIFCGCIVTMLAM